MTSQKGERVQKLQQTIIRRLDNLQMEDDIKIHQTVINAAGKIGKTDFTMVLQYHQHK